MPDFRKFSSKANQFVLTLMVVSLFCQTARADCGDASNIAEKQGIYIPGDDSERQVIGKGRLQFYSAPDEKCKMAGVFVLPKERLNVYYEYGKYTSVIYINPKTSARASGWVRSDRLRSTGLGIAPHQQ
ncbi:hypothetical protein LMG27952_01575 [Paraburkholderia hiiakae]|uniref:Uncharacterized protein n=1 Tax=Paraburkholderia hiiakae TaxID=1081782 RepID=A0ABM8NG10_9BURK|nr:hypothetical protein LMG27952_01575 [Paraburkholderia hiiakae]